MLLPTPPGLFRRLGALIYDLILLTGVLLAATALFLPFNPNLALAPGKSAYQAYLILVCLVFYVWFWTHGGQTLGMRAWKIKLCSSDMSPVTWKQATLRFASAMLSAGFLGLGFFWALFDSKKRTWHDIIAKTQLIHTHALDQQS